MNDESMNTNKKMNDLEIGDRVKVVSVPDSLETENSKIKIGMTGTVKGLTVITVGVEFDDYVSGHCGSWKGKDGYCWYISYERLEKIEETDTADGDVKMSGAKREMINHPVHYTHGKIECIDAIESATCDLTGVEAVCTGNVIKYVWRWKLKNGVEDLEKASWYLQKLIEQIKPKDVLR